MSEDFDDLLAAYNIPATENTKPKSNDDKTLTSPKKLALNGNASTTQVTDVDSEDDDGWIIDESASSDKEPPSTSSTLKAIQGNGGNTSQQQNGKVTNGTDSDNEKLAKGRRKQIFPKLNMHAGGEISTSFTPMQGWKNSSNPALRLPDTESQSFNFMQQKNNLPNSSDLISRLLQTTTVTPVLKGPSINKVVSSTPASEKVMMPVIDQSSIVSVAQPQQQPPPNKSPKAVPETLTLTQLSAKKLVERNRDVIKMFKPTVPCSQYKDYDAPIEGYTCKACYSCFLSESSLLAHLKRPSLIIMYRCNVCSNQHYKFYNRCALWNHILSHTVDVPTMKFDKLLKMVKVQPFTKTEFLDYNFGASCQLQLQDFLETKRDETTVKPTEKLTHCPACLLQVSHGNVDGSIALMEHLERQDVGNIAQCTICQRFLKNLCEKKLHKAVHENLSYCPGCGTKHNNDKEFYEHAQSEKCLYWYSYPLFICALCMNPFYNIQQFTAHLTTKHNLSYFKCSQCQLAFRSAVALDNHFYKSHAKVFSRRTSAQKIMKCPLCKNVFPGTSVMQVHLLETHASHLMKRIHNFVYRCSFCRDSTNCLEKPALLIHWKADHKVATPPVLCDFCGVVCLTLGYFKKHRAICSTLNSTIEKPGEKQKKSANLIKMKNVLQCQICPSSNKVFYSTQASYEGHYNAAHASLGTSPLPPLSVDLMATNLRTVVGPELSQTSRSTSPAVSKSTTPSPEPGSKPTEPGEIKPHTKRQAPDNNESKKETKKMKKIHRSCSKCDFTSNEQDAFQAHIKTHKEDPSHHQCQECGICFRSQMAVTRHMAMKHFIHGPLAPVTIPLTSPTVTSPVKPKLRPILPKVEVPLPKPGKPTSPPAVSPKAKTPPAAETSDMECTVCYRKFTNDTILRNHMRTHGMAFIRSKRTSIIKVEGM